MNPRWFAALLALVLALAGCGPKWMNVPEGRVAHEGLVIEAADGSYRLEHGKPFMPPSQKEPWGELKTTRGGRAEVGTKVPAQHRVIVHVPGRETPLFGKLVFLKVDKRATGPITRSYELKVPEEYVSAATGRRISVVYEPYTARGKDRIAWILWLSDGPF